jgi:hypothetical protein
MWIEHQWIEADEGKAAECHVDGQATSPAHQRVICAIKNFLNEKQSRITGMRHKANAMTLRAGHVVQGQDGLLRVKNGREQRDRVAILSTVINE